MNGTQLRTPEPGRPRVARSVGDFKFRSVSMTLDPFILRLRPSGIRLGTPKSHQPTCRSDRARRRGGVAPPAPTNGVHPLVGAPFKAPAVQCAGVKAPLRNERLLPRRTRSRTPIRICSANGIQIATRVSTRQQSTELPIVLSGGVAMPVMNGKRQSANEHRRGGAVRSVPTSRSSLASTTLEQLTQTSLRSGIPPRTVTASRLASSAEAQRERGGSESVGMSGTLQSSQELAALVARSVTGDECSKVSTTSHRRFLSWRVSGTPRRTFLSPLTWLPRNQTRRFGGNVNSVTNGARLLPIAIRADVRSALGNVCWQVSTTSKRKIRRLPQSGTQPGTANSNRLRWPAFPTAKSGGSARKGTSGERPSRHAQPGAVAPHACIQASARLSPAGST